MGADRLGGVGAQRAAEIATGLLEALVDRDDLSELQRRLDAAVAEVDGDTLGLAHVMVAQADLAGCLLYLLSVELNADQGRVLELLSRTLENLKARDADLTSRLEVRLRPPA